MKILHLIGTLGPGGTERQLITLIKGLSHYKSINCELGLFNRCIHYQGVHELDLEIHFLDKCQGDHFPVFLKLLKICKATKPDIIHTWSSKPTWYAIPVAKLLRIKLLNGSIRYARPVYKFSKIWWSGKLTFPFSDMVVANSKAGLEVHQLERSSKHRYVYNGFDFERINVSRKNHGLVREDLELGFGYVIGMVANFLDGKDQQSVIHAGLKILEKRKDIVFLFIGDGPTRKNMESLIGEEFKKHFVFLGSRTDVEEIVKIIDIGVLLAKQGHAEGISNSIMEYMALSKPVIATRVGGNKELISDEETGFLIRHHDIDALVEKLNCLLDNPDLRENMGKNGRERIQRLFNIEKMVGNFVDIYKQLAE
jgi:glycosyltransferase involved in cell wall biosynthesis